MARQQVIAQPSSSIRAGDQGAELEPCRRINIFWGRGVRSVCLEWGGGKRCSRWMAGTGVGLVVPVSREGEVLLISPIRGTVT